jgi:hypothetical protein
MNALDSTGLQSCYELTHDDETEWMEYFNQQKTQASDKAINYIRCLLFVTFQFQRLFLSQGLLC